MSVRKLLLSFTLLMAIFLSFVSVISIKALTFTNDFYDWYDDDNDIDDFLSYNYNYPDVISYFRNYDNYDAIIARDQVLEPLWDEDDLRFGGELVFMYPISTTTGNYQSFLQIQFNTAVINSIVYDYDEWNGSTWLVEEDTISPTDVYILLFKAVGDTYINTFGTTLTPTFTPLGIEDPFNIELNNVRGDLLVIVLTYEKSFDGISKKNAYNQFYSDGINDGDSMFTFGVKGSSTEYEHGYDEGYSIGYYNGRERGLSEGYLDGFEAGGGSYESGQNDMYNNGSASYGYDPDGAYDFIAGTVEGSSHNVNAGMTMFMAGFERWIVPAIVIIILLGGFITISAIKYRQRGD